MNYRQSQPTIWFWNFLGLGLCAFLCGSGWSVSRAKYYRMELAEFQLGVGNALHEVRKASDTLERSAQNSAIAPQQKREIQQATEKSKAVIEQVESQIEAETNKLTFVEEDL